MNILYNIDFDIIIIAVVLFNLLSGIRGGIKTQIKKTVSTAIPVIILIFTLSPVDQLLSQWKGFDTLFTHVCSFLGITPFMNTIRSLLVAWVIYLVGWGIVQLFFLIFSSRKAVKRVLEVTRWWSRVAGALLSVVNSYLILTLFLLILGTVTSISYVTPVTKAFNAIQIPGYSISLLSRYENIIPGSFNEIDETYALVSGQTLEDYYEGYVNFKSHYDRFNQELDALYPTLSDAEQIIVTKVNNTLDTIYKDNIHLYLAKKNSSTLIENITLWQEWTDLAAYLVDSETYVRLIDIMGFRDYSNIDDFYNQINEVLTECAYACNNVEAYSTAVNIQMAYEDYQKYYPLLSPYLGQNIGSGIGGYAAAFRSTFNNESRLAVFCYNFLQDYNAKNARDELYELYQYAQSFETYRSYYTLLGTSLTPAEKIVFLPEAKSFYQDKDWQTSSMLLSYLNDALGNTVTPGHKLYTDYLLTSLGQDSLDLCDNITQIIQQLSTLKDNHILTETAYNAVLNNMLLESDSLFRERLRAGDFDPASLESLYQLMNSYYDNESLKRLSYIIQYSI